MPPSNPLDRQDSTRSLALIRIEVQGQLRAINPRLLHPLPE